MEFVGQHSYSGGNQVRQAVPVSSSESVPETSRIRDGLTSTEQALSALHEMIGHLEKRLETVLRPVPPQGQAGPSVASAQPVCSHITGRLNILNEGFGHAIQRLNELGSRIEV